MILFDKATVKDTSTLLPYDTTTVVVTFPSRSGNAGLARLPFGGSCLRDQRSSAAHLTVVWNNWFQVSETEAAFAAVGSSAAMQML
jgi:hypothetical protein